MVNTIVKCRDKLETRNVIFDAIRVVAILLVILNHVFDNLLISSSAPYHIAIGFIGRLGVPMFLMLTGLLLLRREYKKDIDVINFWHNKTLRLYLITVFWIVVMMIMDGLVFQLTKKTTFIDFLKEILFLMPVPVEPQMWYMPFIIGIYIATPFLSRLFHEYNTKIFLMPIMISMIYLVAIPMVNDACMTFGLLTEKSELIPLIDVSFFGGYWAVYLLIGYGAVVRRWFNGIKPIILASLFVVTVMAGVMYKTWSATYDIWYNSPFVIIAGTLLFLLLYNTMSKINFNKKGFLSTIITNMSKLSFTVFFVHYMVIRLVLSVISISRNSIMGAAILFLVSSALSFILALCLNSLKRYIRWIGVKWITF